jgi:hypothetical protein
VLERPLLVELLNEVIPLVALESPLLLELESELTVLSMLERPLLVELLNEVIPLVALESPLPVELESELFVSAKLLVTVERPVLVVVEIGSTLVATVAI